VSLFGKSNDLNREFIARPDASKEEILFKWPDMTIRKFTQVTVEPDETALFFKEGKVAGVLPQGRSTPDGALIPFLGDIVDFASGGNMYRAELYFVGTREFVSLPFGGPIDNIEDPETGLAGDRQSAARAKNRSQVRGFFGDRPNANRSSHQPHVRRARSPA
jgi:membrane protease subunit (stomatin/prohibitin family)